MNEADITVVIPTIPPRVDTLLTAAVESVMRQTLAPLGGVVCVLDAAREGAARTRQRGLDAVRTEWVAFLDDDDLWYPNHLETLWGLVGRGAQYAWSWFDGNNPFPGHRGKVMDVESPHHTTMTVLVRTELAQKVGFRQDKPAHPHWSGEDWEFEVGCVAELRRRFGPEGAAARMLGSPDVTWHYRVHPGNTSGLVSRW